MIPLNKAAVLPEDIKMVLQKKEQPQDKPIKNNIAITTPQGGASSEARLEEPEPLPRRNPILHWILSVFFFGFSKSINDAGWHKNVFTKESPLPQKTGKE